MRFCLTGHVAEGVNTAREAMRLADQLGVDMPITGAVKRILFNGLPAREAVEALLSRSQKSENWGKHALTKSVLPPSLIDRHADCIGQVHAA
jgi:hypothetical protein